MTTPVPLPENRRLEGPGSEMHGEAVKQAFESTRPQYDWRFDSWRAPWRRGQLLVARLRYYLVPAALGVTAAFGGAFLYDQFIRPEQQQTFASPDMQARHMYAARGCREAAEVGLAPARRGEPGYWPQWDGDHDGVSCERWHSVRVH